MAIVTSNLGCWDCHLYGIKFDVRCSKHRTPDEQERLDARMSQELRPMYFANLKMLTKIPREERAEGFRWVTPVEMVTREVYVGDGHDPGDEDKQR